MKKYLMRIDNILMIFSFLGASVTMYLLTVQSSLERFVITAQVGQFSQVKNDIKLKPKGSYSWNNLNQSDTLVYSDDYIFSGNNSSAQIKLNNGDVLKISPNTLIFISPDKNNSINLIVFEGSAKYQQKDSSEIQTLNKSEQINLNVRKKTASVKKVVKIAKKPEAVKPEIELSPATITMIAKPTEPPAPAVVSQVTVVQQPVSVTTTVAEQPVKKLYTVKINEAKAFLQTPTALARYKGESAVLKVAWPFDRSALKYTVKVFAKDNLNTPVYKTETKASQIQLEWKKTGQYITQVEKQIRTIVRPPASVGNTDQGIFSLDAITKNAAPKVKFPLENQLVMIESKAPIFLNWEKSAAFSDYVLNISTDPTFKSNNKEIVLDKSKNFQFNISRLPAGVWYWQIKGLSNKNESDWSRVYKFKLINK